MKRVRNILALGLISLCLGACSNALAPKIELPKLCNITYTGPECGFGTPAAPDSLSQ